MTMTVAILHNCIDWINTQSCV